MEMKRNKKRDLQESLSLKERLIEKLGPNPILVGFYTDSEVGVKPLSPAFAQRGKLWTRSPN